MCVTEKTVLEYFRSYMLCNNYAFTEIRQMLIFVEGGEGGRGEGGMEEGDFDTDT